LLFIGSIKSCIALSTFAVVSDPPYIVRQKDYLTA